MDDKKLDNISLDKFELVQQDEKIYDKKFETKPIGYFKDAMIRFSKNRTNVIATTILFIIILCSIIIPIVSNKNIEEFDGNFNDLPPRMPLLEKIGIFDGTRYYDDQVVDPERPSENDPGLFLPVNVQAEDLIEEGTLTNYTVDCNFSSAACVGGQTTMTVRNGFPYLSIISPEEMSGIYLDRTANPYLEISIDELQGEGYIEIYYTIVETVLVDEGGPGILDDVYAEVGTETLMATITEAGVHQVLIADFDDETADTFRSDYYKIKYVNDNNQEKAILNYIKLDQDGTTEPLAYYEAYEFSTWGYDPYDEDHSGTFARLGGVVTYSTYKYKEYDAIFYPVEFHAYAPSDFDALMEEYGDEEGDVCYSENVDPLNTETDYLSDDYYPRVTLNDDCPIKEITRITEIKWLGDTPYFSYVIQASVMQLEGYDELPFFLFGTDSYGRDLFTLLWVATRTSLMLGLIVAFINISIGVVYGAISGYYGGRTDLIMQRISEVIGRIPWLVTLSIMIALFGPGIETLIFILVISGWIGIAAVTRTQFYRYKGREYVLASRTLGAKDGRLIFRHILPNGIGTIITASILSVPYVIFAESTISYLGYGIGHGQSFNIFGLEMSGVSIGVLLADGRQYLQTQPYITLFPAVLISILMITFNMFGNALRDAFNPALRGSE
jgi:ABC-type dipeptide/oligopeptide/nickel transport system permease subunit